MSFGPCLCGDTHCSSCGPAQGNWRCPICRNWAEDGCTHIIEGEDGELAIAPEFQAQVEQIAADERAADDLYAAQMEEEQRLYDEWQSKREV